jgi:hypothetical protein
MAWENVRWQVFVTASGAKSSRFSAHEIKGRATGTRAPAFQIHLSDNIWRNRRKLIQ